MTLLDAPPRHPRTPSDPSTTTELPATDPRPATERPVHTPLERSAPRRPLQAERGMRIRRVRLKSVAKLAAVFWLLAGLILLGTIVAVWNVAQSLGFVESFEETITTSLGLEAFEIDGGGMFGIVAAAIAGLCAFGWVATLAMAAVYNAAGSAFGGLAVETGPLRRRRRAFSWRQRRFVTVAE